jgi:hypothetical protein
MIPDGLGRDDINGCPVHGRLLVDERDCGVVKVWVVWRPSPAHDDETVMNGAPMCGDHATRLHVW